MNWITWLETMCPPEWSNEDALILIKVDCPEVTLEDVKRERKPKKYTDFRNLPQNTPGDTEGGITDAGGLDI